MNRDSLWFHRDFRRLWAGDTASQFGTFVGNAVLPLLAATVLAATPFEMGLLTAAERAAFLLLGLPAGVWVDRLRRRPLMLRADLLRGTLLLTVPLAWWVGVLTLAQLIAVALLVGVCTLLFDVAYQSYLPSLVGRAKLVEGNAKLQASQSVANITGPGIGGGLVQLFGAANAVTATGLGYLASACWLARIRTREPRPGRTVDTSLRADVAEGLRFVFGNPILRAITLCTATSNFASAALTAVEVLFLTRSLGLSPGAVGLVLAASGVGGVLGALTSGVLTRALGQARSIWVTSLVMSPSPVLIALAEPGWRIGLAVLGIALFGYGAVVYNVAQVSYRQAVCPERLLGRMNASIRFVVWGTLPLGSLLGGMLGSWLGVHATVWTTALGSSTATLWVVCSPLRGMRDLPREPVPG